MTVWVVLGIVAVIIGLTWIYACGESSGRKEQKRIDDLEKARQQKLLDRERENHRVELEMARCRRDTELIQKRNALKSWSDSLAFRERQLNAEKIQYLAQKVNTTKEKPDEEKRGCDYNPNIHSKTRDDEIAEEVKKEVEKFKREWKDSAVERLVKERTKAIEHEAKERLEREIKKNKEVRKNDIIKRAQTMMDSARELTVLWQEKEKSAWNKLKALEAFELKLREDESAKNRAGYIADYIEAVINDEYHRSASSTVKKYTDGIRGKIRDLKFDAAYYKYLVEEYQGLFPELRDYADTDAEQEREAAKKSEVSDWLSDDEYGRLSDEQRNQLALDRYVGSHGKSKWQVGRDYEMYIGHLYRNEGWDVEQKGIKDGLEDLGRDLICRKDGRVLVVQCKYWSQEKEIHEKHIAQLYGTSVMYALEHGFFKEMVKPVFVTSTSLSEQARRFAAALGVELRESVPLGDYPRIKCNIGREGRIFHLPFDQQYDSTVISIKDGECYASTVKEAMAKGYRHAMRHFGD